MEVERSMKAWLRELIASPTKPVLPVLSFPAIQMVSSGCDIPPASKRENIDAFFW